MPILNASINQVGQAGVFPAIIYILTNDTVGEVTAAGYLNGLVHRFNIPLSDADMALVTTKTSAGATSTQVGWFEVAKSGDNWSLESPAGPGNVILPTITNHIATYTNTTGTLSDDAATAINGGNIQAGLSGTAGYLASFPATAARGSLRLVAANNAGDTLVTITNASQAAIRTYTIPDGGQSASSFLLTDSGSTQTIATGSLALTLGSITVAAGNISATLGSVAAGTTVTGGTGVTATTGNVTATAGNVVAGSSGVAGTLISFPATAANGTLIISALNAGGAFNTTIRNSVMGQSSVISIPDPGAATANFLLSALSGTQHITSGNLQVDAGSLISGISTGGFVGLVQAFPTTATSGFIAMQAAVNGSGNFGTTISNATTQGQAQVITVPDSGAATANFLLDTGAANILAMQEFVSINEVLSFGTGTWTTTRIAQGNYVKRHTPGDETSIIGIDITPIIRTAASKGFRLDTFEVIYAIAANALDAHSVTLDRIAYADNVAVSITTVPITATLATATQANPYVTTATVDTPAFDVTANSKYIIEVTVNNAAASEYDFYGIMLKFSQTVA